MGFIDLLIYWEGDFLQRDISTKIVSIFAWNINYITKIGIIWLIE